MSMYVSNNLPAPYNWAYAGASLGYDYYQWLSGGYGSKWNYQKKYAVRSASGAYGTLPPRTTGSAPARRVGSAPVVPIANGLIAVPHYGRMYKSKIY